MTQLIVALDLPTVTQNKALATLLNVELGHAWFKVGVPTILMMKGIQLIHDLNNKGCSIFLDLKLYDIKDTVARAAHRAFHDLIADMVTVYSHPDLLEAASNERRHEAQSVLAIGPTTDSEWGGHATPSALTHAQGIVCSVPAIPDILPRAQRENKLIVCPGIRLTNHPTQGHKHTGTPRKAKEAGADFIVVGRPIYEAANPVAAARAILEELNGP